MSDALTDLSTSCVELRAHVEAQGWALDDAIRCLRGDLAMEIPDSLKNPAPGVPYGENPFDRGDGGGRAATPDEIDAVRAEQARTSDLGGLRGILRRWGSDPDFITTMKTHLEDVA